MAAGSSVCLFMPKKRKHSEPDSTLATEKLLNKELTENPKVGVKTMQERIAFLQKEVEGCLNAREQFGRSKTNEEYLAECKRDINLARQRLAEYRAKLGKN